MRTFSRPWSRPAIPVVVLLLAAGSARGASDATLLGACPLTGEIREVRASCTVRMGPDPFDAGAVTETIAFGGQARFESGGTVVVDDARVRAAVALVAIELTGESALFGGVVALGQSAPWTGFVVHSPGKPVPAASVIDARIRMETASGALGADAPISLSARVDVAEETATPDTSFAPVTWGFASGPVALRDASGDLVGWIIDHRMTIAFAGPGAPISPTSSWGLVGPSALLVIAGAGLLLWRQ